MTLETQLHRILPALPSVTSVHGLGGYHPFVLSAADDVVHDEPYAYQRICQLAERAAMQGLFAEAAHLIDLAIRAWGEPFTESNTFFGFSQTEPGEAVLALREAVRQ